MKVKEITKVLEEKSPLHLQESYDNAGLIVGDYENDVSGIIVTLDVTEEVIDEAMLKNCNMIVAHHPIVFRGLKKITGKNYVERCVIKAIKNDISIYAIHTNLDNNFSNGVNTKIAEKLGLVATMPLVTKDDDKFGGVIGTLKEPKSFKDFLEHVNNTFYIHSGGFRYTNKIKDEISSVAVCGGAGNFMLSDAIEKDADVFISSDFTYHQFFDAEDKIVIIDIGHYESEQFTKDLLVDELSKQDVFVHKSKINTNPVKYF